MVRARYSDSWIAAEVLATRQKQAITHIHEKAFRQEAAKQLGRRSDASIGRMYTRYLDDAAGDRVFASLPGAGCFRLEVLAELSQRRVGPEFNHLMRRIAKSTDQHVILGAMTVAAQSLLASAKLFNVHPRELCEGFVHRLSRDEITPLHGSVGNALTELDAAVSGIHEYVEFLQGISTEFMLAEMEDDSLLLKACAYLLYTLHMAAMARDFYPRLDPDRQETIPGFFDAPPCMTFTLEGGYSELAAPPSYAAATAAALHAPADRPSIPTR
jgi:hypothetical protein